MPHGGDLSYVGGCPADVEVIIHDVGAAEGEGKQGCGDEGRPRTSDTSHETLSHFPLFLFPTRLRGYSTRSGWYKNEGCACRPFHTYETPVQGVVRIASDFGGLSRP